MSHILASLVLATSLEASSSRREARDSSSLGGGAVARPRNLDSILGSGFEGMRGSCPFSYWELCKELGRAKRVFPGIDLWNEHHT